MNILLYVPLMSQEWGGVRQYSIALFNMLAKDKANTYYIYHNSEDLQILSVIKSNPQFKLVKDTDFVPLLKTRIKNKIKSLLNRPFKLFRLQYNLHYESIIDRICDLYSIDIIHCPYQYIPDTIKAKLITTLHDVQEIHFPQFFTAEDRAHRANFYLSYMRKSDHVIVSYKHVKHDLIKYFNIPEDKISVVLLDMGELWYEKFSSEDVLPLEQLCVPEKYILYPANTWEHKNHNNLLKAVAILRDDFGVKVSLICTGHQNVFFQKSIAPLLDELNLHDRVKFLGIVNERELYSLYKLALGVVVPTLYEAGSFPLVESILLGVPVICSNVTSLPETIQNKRFIFDPKNELEIANKIKELWSSDSFRKDSIENSIKVSSFLRNRESTEEIVKVYYKLNQ